MFDIAWTEYLLIAIVALVLLGPKELPIVLRTIGHWIAKARQITASFERQLYTLDSDPSLDKDSPGGKSIGEAVPPLEVGYQRVFDKQHVNEQGRGDFLKIKSPYPKPWL
jgi:Tat protein translocase TatB subunit